VTGFGIGRPMIRGSSSVTAMSWDALTDLGHVREIESYSVPDEQWIGPLTPVQDLTNRYRVLRDYLQQTRRYDPSNAPVGHEPTDTRPRREALHRVICWEAWRLDNVRAFRDKWFPQGGGGGEGGEEEELLPNRAKAQKWILARAPQRQPQAGEDTVTYLTPHGYGRSVPVGDDSALQELSLVAGALARRYRWKETEATVLVLTALFPNTPPPVLATHHQSPDYPQHRHIIL